MTTKSGSGPSIARLCAAAIFSCLSLARRLALAFPTALDDTGGEGFTVGCCPLVTCGPTVLFTGVRGRGILRTSENSVNAKFALRVDLLLYDRLRWLYGGYGVGVPMHDLPGALFGPEDALDA